MPSGELSAARGRLVGNQFFAGLAERVHYSVYTPAATQARRDLFHYIEGFYNSRRLHSAPGYIGPAEMERRAP